MLGIIKLWHIIMSGYVRVPIISDELKNGEESDVENGSENDRSELEDCAIFADNKDHQDSPLLGVKERKKLPKFSEFLRHRRNPARHKKENDDFLPEQFQVKCRPVPWKAIWYAIGLFVLGTAMLIAGCLIHTGHVDNEKYGDRLWPLIIFGALMFIPGSYHVYLAVNVFLGTPGYSFDDIPQFD